MRVALMCLLILLTGCKGKAQEEGPDPLKDLIQQFEQDRKAGLVEYGASSIQSAKQALATTDCHVFDVAATKRAGSLGQWSAMTDAMYYRALMGCSDPAAALVQYEETRRALGVVWGQELAKLPDALRAPAQNTPMGKLIANSLREFANEGMACGGLKAQKERFMSKSRVSMDSLKRTCRTDIVNREVACQEAWMVVNAHSRARVARDALSWNGELFARYHMVFNYCTPQAANEYVQFHAQVPREIFTKKAYRLSIAIDPILMCSLQRPAQENISGQVNPYRYYSECSKKYGLGTLHMNDPMPARFTLHAYETDPWFFDPSQSSQNPKLWSFGPCENEAVAALRTKGLNMVGPAALKRFCKGRY